MVKTDGERTRKLFQDKDPENHINNKLNEVEFLEVNLLFVT